METRTIRAWHYTRLTDAEVEQLRTIGIALSSLDASRRRLEAQAYAEDPLRDQGRAYAAKAIWAGVPTTYREFADQLPPHGGIPER